MLGFKSLKFYYLPSQRAKMLYNQGPFFMFLSFPLVKNNLK